jgi:hypothetical protein
MRKLALTAAAFVGVLALRAYAADVAGDWKIVGSIGQMPVEVVCTLNESGSKLSGACRNQEVGELPLTGEVKDNSASWSYRVNFQGQEFDVSYNGTLESASAMKGDISVNGSPQGSFTGTKQ